MNADRLLAHYERIADAPDAIARLRRFILDLAVRGKLVPQDPKDEPAAELLKRIAKGTARLLKKGDIKKPGATRQLVKDEIWPVPASWSFVPLELLAAPTGLFTDGDWVESKDQDPTGGVRLTQLADVGVGEYRDRSSRFMNAATAARLNCTFLTPGDILIARMPDPLGRACIFPGDPKPSVTVVDVAVLRVGSQDFVASYIVLAINSPQFARNVEAKAAGTTRSRISRGNLSLLPFPLPPLAEQHRIVAKVDELMALCDRMEAARSERETTRDRLAASSLARLNAPDPETFEADARFVLNALPAITTRPDQIKQLRQTILNLAVRGKLVEQDPKDEPASELLKRIVKEKAKSTGRNKFLPEIEDAEKTFDAPASWHWVRMGNVFSIRTGFAFKSSTYVDKGTLVFRVTNFDRDGSFDLSDVVFFSTEQIDSKMSGFLMEPGEIIMVMVGGTIGKTTIVDELILPALLNQNMWRIRSFGGVMSNKFEYLLIKNINQSIQGLTKSTHGHFAMSDYEKRVIPLPPLAEQHRIVAKVDKLMALCDRLETSLDAASDTRRRLLDALLAEALAPAERELEAVA